MLDFSSPHAGRVGAVEESRSLKKLHVYLIPGFFGFANFGDFKYFAHVRQLLDRLFGDAGREVALHYVATLPTASLRMRTGRLLEVIRETAGSTDEPIHLIGHSTGGLDARLFAAPGLALPARETARPFIRRLRSVVSIATPHFGTPLASFFTSLLGQKLLQLLSVVTMHTIRLGTVPLPALLVLARMATLPIVKLSIDGGVLGQVYRDVLKDFNEERRRGLIDFFEQVSGDQALLPQLTPEGMDLLVGRASFRRGVRYASVVTRARPPGLRANLQLGPRPTHLALYAVYRGLYRIASTMDASQAPELTRDQQAALTRGFGGVPEVAANDAIVPSLSQVWGDVIHTAWADHLDVIGHFGDPHHRPPHVDWLTTASDFSRKRFEALWGDVADYVLAAS